MAEVGQSAALREIFARVYAAASPRRSLVLGCTTGKDLALLDPRVTTVAVGVDVNPEYLAMARRELDHLACVELIEGDVLELQLASGGFDLVHAALLLEYVNPGALFARMRSWLAADGRCTIVSQDPAPGVASVSESGHESLRILEGHMSLLDADDIERLAARAGLRRISLESVPLPGRKTFSVSTFRSGAPGGAF